MPKHLTSILALGASLAILSAVPATAANGQIVITQAKANAGNVTPGDAPGFPVTLTQPGSYILAGNLQPPAGKIGILVASNDVTIDMNGFRLRGVGGPGTGIYAADFNNVTVRNGTVTGFAADGIHGTGKNLDRRGHAGGGERGGRHLRWRHLLLRARQHGRGKWKYRN
jgi:hypothetical protein